MITPSDQENEGQALGWEAINEALTKIYPGQEPAHFGTILSMRLGGKDPLDGISAYRAEHPRPHWHFVTYGMSDLYAKESQDPEWSGWGFEFTFRLVRDAAEEQPPIWALNFLQNLARYVFNSGNIFQPGHHIDLNGPIALDRKTEITAAMFAADPQLPEIRTPYGRLQFIQIVGITMDELSAARAWNMEKFVTLTATRDSMLLTDLDRSSRLLDPQFAKEVEDGTQTDGSSTAMLYADNISWAEVDQGRKLELTVGAKAVDSLMMMLKGRATFGRSFAIKGPKTWIAFEPGDAISWKAQSDHVVVVMPAAAAARFVGGLRIKQGIYPVNDNIILRVVPSHIKDHDGQVVAVIGE